MRRRLLRMIVDAGQGHPGGDLSATDILAALYFDILRIDPANPRSPDRDRFVMSKGHCTGALYSALAGAGFFPEAELGRKRLVEGKSVPVRVEFGGRRINKK